ncbi:MAG TPA: XdhC family protein [Burkholderiaceae bacterium]|nr:XdhC family protein [Burkholderiaceae bacterium]
MSIPGSRLLEAARTGAVWVRVERVQGSAPREPGASMLVDADRTEGTIGGGHLEFEAIARARRMLATGGPRAAHARLALGPSLGQCCGGTVDVSWRIVDPDERPWIERVAALDAAADALGAAHGWLVTRPDAADGSAASDGPAGFAGAAASDGSAGFAASAGAAASAGSPPRPVRGAPHSTWHDAPPAAAPGELVSRVESAPWHVWVFGAGHVGEALVRVLGTLPARVAWIDPRPGAFPPDPPPNARCLESDGPAHEVAAMPAGADAIVMTHSHALDLDVCAALLARDDLGRIGVIGSATKAARFRRRLAQRGLDAARLHCPIGARPDGPVRTLDRHPGAIAVSVAFELWRRRRVAAEATPAAAGAAR